ncbi:MAG: CocE/NonD family hydrolase [Gemmataceae bacterium]|nr:CocE/NonD family hydrolase [Gemmataceae bacterium]
MPRPVRGLLPGLVVLLLPAAAAAQPAPPSEHPIKSQFTKYEHQIPMRDGVKLFTAVYVPKDAADKLPIMLCRTPYGVGPYGPDQYPDRIGPSPLFEKGGYVVVKQDVRGRMKSEGKFLHGRPHNPKKGPKDADESTDAYDTIDWLVKNVPGNNGKVGQWGISYPGFYTAHGMIDAHPALKAASPQAPVTDLFDGDDCRHNGAFLLAHNFWFMGPVAEMSPDRPGGGDVSRLRQKVPDGYQFFLKMGPLANAEKYHLKGVEPFWNDLMTHTTYDDFCKARDLRPHLKGVKPAVLTVGGWFDAEDIAGTINTFQEVEKAAPSAGNHFVMGPWTHGGWAGGPGDRVGDVSFNTKAGEYYREKVEFPFFEYHLHGKGDGKFPKAKMFETGANRWRAFDAWPPKDGKAATFFLRGGGRLDQTQEGVTSTIDPKPADEFVSDPAKPVPHVAKTLTGMDGSYMTADQRFAAQRPDVLVYQTEPLTEDTTVAGPVEVELRVSTTGTDADWVVKLIDVYPDDFPDPNPNPKELRMGGFQQLVRGEPFRGKFRNSMTKPEPFEPGKVTTIKFAMPDVLHTFRPGHRIMVQVQSSWFPLIDRNPQTFCDIPNAAEADFKKQTHTVHRGGDTPSRVTLPVIK